MHWGWLLACCLINATESEASPATASPAPVQVQLNSGRTFRGWVDPKTSDQELWLRFETERMLLLRPIAWSQVREATCSGQRFTGEAARDALFREMKAAPRPPDRPSDRVAPAPEQSPQRSSVPVPQLAGTVQPKLRVRSLQVEAILSNWDQDAAADGLFLYVLPLDQAGQVVPVRGSVTCELAADAGLRTTRTAELFSAGRWVRRLEPGQFSYRGAGIRLPFEAFDPERQWHWGDYARLKVRLSVPGQGSFETVIDAVRVRTFAPLRDRIRQHQIVHQ
jgi:hypothetical protein